jgi:hypothetical protein
VLVASGDWITPVGRVYRGCEIHYSSNPVVARPGEGCSIEICSSMSVAALFVAGLVKVL